MPPADRPKSERKRRRGWLSLLLLAAALIVIIRLMIPVTVGEQVRRAMLTKLHNHYPNLQFSIDSGHYDTSGDLILTGIKVHEVSRQPNRRPLLEVNQVVVHTQLDLTAIRDGSPVLCAPFVQINGVTANAWLDAENRWSLEQLWPLPKSGPGCPQVELNDVRLRICQSPDRNSPTLEVNELQARIVRTADEGDRQFSIVGGGGIAESIAIQGMLTPDRHLSVRGQLRRLSLDTRLYDRLPENLRSRFSELQSLQVNADVAWEINGPAEQWQDHWSARAAIHYGRFEDPRLPAALEKLTGRFALTPQGVEIQSADFTINGASCSVSGKTQGLKWPSPASFRVTAENLTVDAALTRALPGRAAELEEKFHPRGHIDLLGSFAFDGKTWNLDTDVNCRDLSLVVDKFPYPVEHLNGRIRYHNRVATARNLRCQAGGAKLDCSFQLTPPESGLEHWIDIRGDGAIAIDDTLVRALTPAKQPKSKLEEFVRTLSPGGDVRLLRARLGRDAEGQTTKAIDLEVSDGRLRYEKFPYPLYEVRGRITVLDQYVSLSQFQAQNNGGARIQCEGTWVVAKGEGSSNLDLTITGYAIPLDDGLRTALPLGARQTWDALAPSGVLERLLVRVQHNSADVQPELTITAEQWANVAGIQREVSITPTALPYQLNIARGRVTMRDGRVAISEIEGYHGTSRLSAEGNCHRRADGRWQLDINLLTGSRIRPDTEFINALPDDIRGSFNKLQLREPVSLRGQTQLILPDQHSPRVNFSWDVLMQLEGNRIGDSGPVHDIRGEIEVRGTAGENGTAAEGLVQIDSMHVGDLQLTAISGPFSIDGPNLTLGRLASKNETTSFEPIRGRIFGGGLDLSGGVLLTNGMFDVRLKLNNAALSTLLTELNQPQSNMQGRFGGNVRLEGILGAANLLRGSGTASLSKAKLYQLPVIVQVLNQLSLAPEEDAAFTDGTTQFTLDGDLLTLNDLKLWGDLVVLHGSGTVNRRRELDLAFNTRVSPQSIWSKMVTPLRSQKYTLWTIYVRGPMQDPRIERRALQGVGETLERLFPVMEAEAALVPGIPLR